jgi:hypothetical protein
VEGTSSARVTYQLAEGDCGGGEILTAPLDGADPAERELQGPCSSPMQGTLCHHHRGHIRSGGSFRAGQHVDLAQGVAAPLQVSAMDLHLEVVAAQDLGERKGSGREGRGDG